MFPNLSNFIIRHREPLLILGILIVCLVSLYLHPFWLTGDTPTYIKSVEFLKGGLADKDFLPFRIISTYLALNLLILGEKLFGNIFWAWTIMNSVFYIIAGYYTYKIILELYGSERAALLGMFLIIGNYAVVIHGLAFALDMGGWALYLASAYLSLKYLKTKEEKFVLLSGVVIGIGSLLKEYALGGFPILLGSVILSNYGDWKKMVKLSSIVATLSFLPALILHFFVYLKFDYTYLDWYREQRFQYGGIYYNNRIVEYIKSFGAVYGVGWFFFLNSLYLLIKTKFLLIGKRELSFLLLLFLSASPLWFWPGIVPRTVFIMIPFAVALSALTIKYYENRWYLFVFPVAIYIAWSYLLDGYIFNLMNIDVVLGYLLFWAY